MKKISEHIILLRADSFSEACRQVYSFFEKNSLVLYDSIEVVEEQSAPATDGLFTALIDKGLQKNGETILKLVHELENLGITTIADLGKIPHGYASKTLHTLTHLLDGFIGVDSGFYSLVDDSHTLPQKTSEEIQETPDLFWVLSLHAFATSQEAVEPPNRQLR